MSFLQLNSIVKEGDTVIVYLNINNIYSIRIRKGEVFQTKYGALRHDEVIGSTYGSIIQCKRGWVYILHPTPELWTITLPHRTQILYTTDISLVILLLDLKPGSLVIEAGTGSGSLSHAIARSISPNGHLYTYDFHEQRVALAKEEFNNHGLSNVVSVQHRDVCIDGFNLTKSVDAVFLDLPKPWEAIDASMQILKERGGRICSFSPCIEQVQKTCSVLQSCGFSDIATSECLLRTFEVKCINQPALDLPVKHSAHGWTNIKDFNAESNSEASPTVKKKSRVNNSKCPSGAGCSETFWTAIPPLQMAGHTGYLTFATLYHRLK